jgi:hypothetical protein
MLHEFLRSERGRTERAVLGRPSLHAVVRAGHGDAPARCGWGVHVIMKRLDPRVFAWACLLVGCGPQVAVGDDEASTGRATSETRTAPSMTMTGPMTSTSGSSGTTDHGTDTFATFGVDDASDEGWVDFINPPDGGGVCGPALPPGTLAHCWPCDVMDQDCSFGEKCMPWANHGGTAWNATRCSPIDPDAGRVGEPCEVQGSAYAGLDDCNIGLMCMFVDPTTQQGVCAPFCTGSYDNPICDDETICMNDYEGVIALCLPPCDPLLDDCELGTCIPSNDDFVCFAEGDSAAIGEACEVHNDCAPGAVCLGAQATGTCDGYGCCTSVCDLAAPEPSAVCLDGQTCTPWYEPGAVEPPLDAIGVCTVG